MQNHEHIRLLTSILFFSRLTQPETNFGPPSDAVHYNIWIFNRRLTDQTVWSERIFARYFWLIDYMLAEQKCHQSHSIYNHNLSFNARIMPLVCLLYFKTRNASLPHWSYLPMLPYVWHNKGQVSWYHKLPFLIVAQ